MCVHTGQVTRILQNDNMHTKLVILTDTIVPLTLYNTTDITELHTTVERGDNSACRISGYEEIK